MDPAGRLLMLLTIPIFGVAFLVFGIDGWGSWVAIALLALWVVLAGASAYRQAKIDGIEPVRPPPQTRLQRAVKIALLLPPALLFIRAAWLDQSGAADEVVKNWRDGAMLVWLICFPLIYVVDWVASKLRREP